MKTRVIAAFFSWRIGSAMALLMCLMGVGRAVYGQDEAVPSGWGQSIGREQLSIEGLKKTGAPPLMRVWLTHVDSEPSIRCYGPCVVQPIDGKTKGKRLAKLLPMVAGLSPTGIRLGDFLFENCSAIDIIPKGNNRIQVDKQSYAGAIRLLRAGEELAVINSLDLESYLLGVLGGEMPPGWPSEALKAQAVAARTYALHQRQIRLATNWDVTANVEDQVYRGGRVPKSVQVAVNATRGQVLSHKGLIFPAFFHSTCGGRTEQPGIALGKTEYDFLVGVECSYCGESKYFTWKADLSADELLTKLKAAVVAINEPLTSVECVASPEGVARMVKISWNGGETLMPMVDFRREVGRMVVLSGKFECQADAKGFHFRGRGFGHGAGMCQYGARGMARLGKDYKTILMYFYRNTTLERLY